MLRVLINKIQIAAAISLSLAVISTFDTANATTKSENHSKSDAVKPTARKKSRASKSGKRTPVKAKVIVHSSRKSLYDDKPSIGKRLLWYIPNRILDFIDIFRLRAKVGPGLSVSAQVTEALSVYAGRQSIAWIGLPGPRYPYRFAKPWGIEKERGLRFMGVDATDDFTHEIRYSPTEIDLGAHLLLVGGEIGFDIIEIADFWAGFVFIDIRNDDIERHIRFVPAVSHNLGWDMFDEVKPRKFDTFTSRLDYLRENVPLAMNSSIRDLDYSLSGMDAYDSDSEPAGRLRLGIFLEIEKEDSLSFKFDPTIDIDVKLPGLEQRWNLFVSQQNVNELPGTLPSDRENNDLNIGLSSPWGRRGVRFSAGVKARIPPEVFTSVKWEKKYTPGNWYLTPHLRAYWESDDGLGQVTSLRVNHWLDTDHKTLFRSVSAGRFTNESNGWDWEQTLAVGFIQKLISDEHHENVSAKDVAYGLGLSTSIFGHINSGSSIADRYRGRFVVRRQIYKQWIYLEISPEVEFRRERDWEPSYTFRVGFDMLFYGINDKF